MKLYGVTVVYNEEALIPIVMPYLEKMGYDKLVVWDNGSTDHTAELLSQYSFIELRHYETDTWREDDKLQKIVETINEFKSNLESGQTWMTIADFDEVIKYNGRTDADIFNVKWYLSIMGNFGYNVCREHIWNLVDNGNKVDYGQPFYWDKPLLFRLDGSDMISITYGNHDMYITYNGNEPKVFYNTKMLSVFHLKYYNDEIFLARQQNKSKRDYTYGEHKMQYIADKEKNLNEYCNVVLNSIPYEDYHKHKMLNGVEHVGKFLV